MSGRAALPAPPARLARLAAMLIFAALVALAAALAAGASAADRPHPPLDVTASAGTTGTIAVVGWTSVADDVSYRVWRSTRSLTGFEPVGSTDSSTFADASGIPGRTYFYRVTSMRPDGDESDPSTATAGVRADWNASPHASYGKGNLCLTCHALHRAWDEADVSGGEVAICESCHDGRGARSNVKDGPTDSFALASGHRVEEATRGADLTNECSACHSPHADPRARTGLYRTKVAGRKVDSGGNGWCDACHDDASSWSRDYPSSAEPVRDASGYPVRGTYPGPTVYASSTASGHAGVRSAGGATGDCLLCHAAHRGPNAYDGLLSTYRAPSAPTLAEDQSQGSYAALCLACHAGQAEWKAQGAADIAVYVRRSGTGQHAAHSIVTSGGTLPVGAPVPCYDCHNPHGSSRGNGSLISDELGGKLSTAEAGAVRSFCFSCHSSVDGLRWDSAEATYAPVGTGTVEGLRRDGSDGSQLRLVDAPGSAHEAVRTDSCYDCHGRDYGPGGSNVHAPRRAGPPPAAPAAAPLSEDKPAAP